MRDIVFSEREKQQMINNMIIQNQLIDELVLENKTYKKENERLKKYEKWYLEHRARVDKGE